MIFSTILSIPFYIPFKYSPGFNHHRPSGRRGDRRGSRRCQGQQTKDRPKYLTNDGVGRGGPHFHNVENAGGIEFIPMNSIPPALSTLLKVSAGYNYEHLLHKLYQHCIIIIIIIIVIIIIILIICSYYSFIIANYN